MIKNIRHIGIVVEDLAKSLWFYQDLLGFTIVKEADEKGIFIDKILSLTGAAVKTVKMKTDDACLIELLLFSKPLADVSMQTCITRIGLTHLAFSVENIEKAYNQFKEAGLHINSPPQISPDGFAKVFFCRAPEGTFVELVQEL